MNRQLNKTNYFFDNMIKNSCIFFFIVIFTVNAQNSCMPSASNDGIFVGINLINFRNFKSNDWHDKARN